MPQDNMLAALQNAPQLYQQNMPQQNNILAPLQGMPQQGLRVGKNPNPKFPRLRNWWEEVKEAGGKQLWGEPGGIEQHPTVTPEQQGILKYLMQMIQGRFENPTAGFEPIEQQARAQFQQNTLPGIAERFTSMGAGNALSSPAFASQLGQAGAGLEGELASQKAQYGQQNMQQTLAMLQMLLNPRSQNIYNPGSTGAVEKAVDTAIKALMASIKG